MQEVAVTRRVYCVNMHIAEINIARAIAPLHDPCMADFVAALDGVNAIADASPGFVWRLKAPDGTGGAYVHAVDDPRVLVNLTVWESLEALRAFTYGPAHAALLRDRRRWFRPMPGPSLALWWIEAGAIPTVEEGFARLRRLAAGGPSRDVFTFAAPFPPALSVVD